MHDVGIVTITKRRHLKKNRQKRGGRENMGNMQYVGDEDSSFIKPMNKGIDNVF